MLSNIKGYLSLSVITVLLVSCVITGVKLKAANAALDKTNTELARVTLLIDSQNMAIIQWREAAILAQNKITKAQRDAIRQNQNAQKQVFDIMNNQIPDSCESAIKWGALEAIKLKPQ